MGWKLTVLASRIGARLGNWNDRTSSGDTRAELGRRWRLLDRVASRLYADWHR